MAISNGRVKGQKKEGLRYSLTWAEAGAEYAAQMLAVERTITK